MRRDVPIYIHAINSSQSDIIELGLYVLQVMRCVHQHNKRLCTASVDTLNTKSIDPLSRGHETQARTTSKRLPFCFGDKIN